MASAAIVFLLYMMGEIQYKNNTDAERYDKMGQVN